MVPWDTQISSSLPTNGILISSAIFVGFTRVPNTETDTKTMLSVTCVATATSCTAYGQRSLTIMTTTLALQTPKKSINKQNNKSVNICRNYSHMKRVGVFLEHSVDVFTFNLGSIDLTKIYYLIYCTAKYSQISKLKLPSIIIVYNFCTLLAHNLFHNF